MMCSTMSRDEIRNTEYVSFIWTRQKSTSEVDHKLLQPPFCTPLHVLWSLSQLFYPIWFVLISYPVDFSNKIHLKINSICVISGNQDYFWMYKIACHAKALTSTRFLHVSHKTCFPQNVKCSTNSFIAYFFTIAKKEKGFLSCFAFHWRTGAEQEECDAEFIIQCEPRWIVSVWCMGSNCKQKLTEQAQGIWHRIWTEEQINVNTSNHPRRLRWSFRWPLIV